MNPLMTNASNLKTSQIQPYLPLLSRGFRLLKLHAAPKGSHVSCELKHYQVHNAPHFRALSYTWDNPFELAERNSSKEPEEILVDGKAMHIGKNLADALKALRD